VDIIENGHYGQKDDNKSTMRRKHEDEVTPDTWESIIAADKDDDQIMGTSSLNIMTTKDVLLYRRRWHRR